MQKEVNDANVMQEVCNNPELLIPNRPIAFNRDFVELGIGASGALFLSQAVYWSRNETTVARGGWFYKTIEEWTQETGLTLAEQKTIKKALLELGYIEIKKEGLPAKNYFYVNAKKIMFDLAKQRLVRLKSTDQSGDFNPTGQAVLTPLSYSKTTTEITSDIKAPRQKVLKFTLKDMEMVDLLVDLILANNPAWVMKGNKDKWAEDINKLNRLDSRTYEQIEFMIRWTQKDSFWSQNILSASKLREKFNDLIPKIKNQRSKPKGRGFEFAS